jgi:iron-sulfur cluster repair protein YtfE (RIC family)
MSAGVGIGAPEFKTVRSRLMNAAESLPAPQRLEQLLQLWRDEHAELVRSIREITMWLGEVAALQDSPYAELTERLTAFRHRMLRHFEREDVMGADMQEVYGCVEAEANSRRAEGDHHHLINRVDTLIAKLTSSRPAFDSFQDAIQQVSLFVDAVEQHEEEESQGLQWLSSPASESRPAGEF